MGTSKAKVHVLDKQHFLKWNAKICSRAGCNYVFQVGDSYVMTKGKSKTKWWCIECYTDAHGNPLFVRQIPVAS